ncbi:hypothetical protein NCS56_00179900 [Fusarium sp. Ph1]|nr:hypothetical protein NCS56_00179900 [Fusarium sp. Ph1]
MGARKVEKRSPSCDLSPGSALLPQTSVVSPDDVVSAMFPAPPPLEPASPRVWQCCNCAMGWFNIQLNSTCPSCLHRRCGSCTYAAY